MIGEPEVAPRIGRGIGGLFVVLEEALGVGKGPLHLRDAGRGEKDDLRPDVRSFQFARDDLRGVPPEGRGLGFEKVPDDEPVEFGKGLALEPGVLAAHGGVLSHAEEAPDPARRHVHEQGQVGVVAGDLGMKIVTVIVFLCCGITVLGLEIGDGEFGVVAPIARGHGGRFREDEVRQRVMGLPGVGHVQVAGQGVVEGGDVRGTLDRGMAPKGEDAAAGPADVPQEGLEDPCGADDLDPHGVLGPAHGIGDVGRLFAAGILKERLGDPEKSLLWAAADAGHHVRRVAGIVALQDLEDRLRVSEGRVRLGPPRQSLAEEIAEAPRWGSGGRFGRGFALIGPGVVLVGPLVGGKTGENAVQVLRIPVIRMDQGRRIGVVENVFPEKGVTVPAFGFKDVADQPAEKGDVRARPDLHVDIAKGRRAGEARIDVDQDGAVVRPGFQGPAEGHGMALGHVRAHDEDGVGMDEIPGKGRGTAASERDPQTGDRGGVSDPGLVFHVDDA